MSQAHLDEWDTLRTCPYDKSHRVRAIKYATHLLKCRRNHEGSAKLQVCPFNATHLIPHIERAHHLDTCPDRVVIEREVVSTKRRDVNTKPGPVYNNHAQESSSYEPEEDWDLECAGLTIHKYDPEKAMSKAKYRNQATFSGMKPAEKKQYRKMLFTQNGSASTASSMSEQEECERDMDDQLTQYRFPKNPNPFLGLSMQNSPTNSVVQVGTARGRPTAIPFPPGSAERMFAIGRGRGLVRNADPIRTGALSAHANGNFNAGTMPRVTSEQFEDDDLNNLRFMDTDNAGHPFMAG